MNPRKLLPSLLLLLVLLLAAGLRFWGLDGQSLWNDEGTSVALAQRPLATIARDAANDIHPPLYYWLLHGWVRLLGTGEAAVRSLSALLGVALVATVYVLGVSLVGRAAALVAALLAALSPFQVYYSQEARMYMLLAILTAAAMLALVAYTRSGKWPTLAGLALLEAAGLYTHYSFAFIALVLNLAFALSLQWGALRRALPWMLAQAGAVVLYLPWLPIALRQVRTWPSPAQTTPFLAALVETGRWLVAGPTVRTGRAAPVLAVAAVVAVAGGILLALGGESTRQEAGGGRRDGKWVAGLLGLWLLVPVALILALGLYREAYMKFLLVTSPALCLLLAAGLILPVRLRPLPTEGRARHGARLAWRLIQFALGLAVVSLCVLGLRNYFDDPAYARDDYRGIAAYVQAAGRPGDAILLDAPGQQEVFGYYYRGPLLVAPLPASRPADRAATEAALAALVPPGGRIFAVLWATEEGDPEHIVEGWLERHTYQALASWYGNVRLAVYAVPAQVPSSPDHLLDTTLRDAETGNEVRLAGYSLPPERLAAGDIVQIALFWEAARTLGRPYQAFVHLLDEVGYIVGQRDAELRPGVGQPLASLWGVPIHPATPPGTYRIEVGAYEGQTGRRLATADGAEQVWLEPIQAERPVTPAPPAALRMQHTAGWEWGALCLLGYDVNKLGFDHQPDTPLQAGDVLRVNLYWQAVAAPGAGWQVAVDLVDSGGSAWAGLVGEPVPAYPTALWQAGDVWRGQYDLAIPGDAPAGRYRLRMQATAPDGTRARPFLSKTLRIGP